jgi:flagellar motor switch protein FliG
MADCVINNINNFVDNKKDEMNEFLSVLNLKMETALEETITKFDSDSVERILQNLTICEIIKVLKGASDNLRDFILSNIKGRATKSLLIYELQYAVIGEDEIINAQEELMKVVQRLRECGEI